MNGSSAVGNKTPTHSPSSARWTLMAMLVCWLLIDAWHPALGVAESQTQDDEAAAPGPHKLSVEEALGLLVKRNFDLFAARYGVDGARAQQITAGLFPNPVLSVGLFSSFTQGCAAGRCGGGSCRR